MFVLGPFFEDEFSPKGWQNNTQLCKIPKCSDLIDFLMILPISICKFDAKHTPDAFKHIPDPFWRLRDRKTRKKAQNLKQLKTCAEKNSYVYEASELLWGAQSGVQKPENIMNQKIQKRAVGPIRESLGWWLDLCFEYGGGRLIQKPKRNRREN